MSDKKFVLGIDVGKTKICCGVFSDDLILVNYVTYPSGKTAQEILDVMTEMVTKYTKTYKSSIVGVGIATFGIVDKKRGRIISSGVVSDWNNIQLSNYFETRFHTPVYVQNDVKAALYGEYSLLNAKKDTSALYLSLGTNIGMAFIKDGLLLYGDTGRFGEICNFMPIREQYSLGELIGGQGISQQYYDQTGCWKAGHEIFALAMQEDEVARNIYQHVVMVVAELMSWFDFCFDPSYLILGGGVICNNDKLFQMIKLQYNNISSQMNDKLFVATLGEKSGVYGVAVLTWQRIKK